MRFQAVIRNQLIKVCSLLTGRDDPRLLLRQPGRSCCRCRPLFGLQLGKSHWCAIVNNGLNSACRHVVISCVDVLECGGPGRDVNRPPARTAFQHADYGPGLLGLGFPCKLRSPRQRVARGMCFGVSLALRPPLMGRYPGIKTPTGPGSSGCPVRGRIGFMVASLPLMFKLSESCYQSR